LIEVVEFAAEPGGATFEIPDAVFNGSQLVAGSIHQYLIDARHFRGRVEGGHFIGPLHELEPGRGVFRFFEAEPVGEAQPLFPMLGAFVEKFAGGFLRFPERVEFAPHFITACAILGEAGDLQVVAGDQADLGELGVELVFFALRRFVVSALLGILGAEVVELVAFRSEVFKLPLVGERAVEVGVETGVAAGVAILRMALADASEASVLVRIFSSRSWARRWASTLARTAFTSGRPGSRR
jgi:hypothetical protein